MFLLLFVFSREQGGGCVPGAVAPVHGPAAGVCHRPAERGDGHADAQVSCGSGPWTGVKASPASV